MVVHVVQQSHHDYVHVACLVFESNFVGPLQHYENRSNGLGCHVVCHLSSPGGVLEKNANGRQRTREGKMPLWIRQKVPKERIFSGLWFQLAQRPALSNPTKKERKQQDLTYSKHDCATNLGTLLISLTFLNLSTRGMM